MSNAIEIQNLSKKYGSKVILDNISLTIKKGEIYGLIGRNGAGKTTIMKIILGLVKRSSGKVALLDEKNIEDARLKTGSIIETPVFFDNKSAYKNLVYHAKLIGMKNYDAEINNILTMVGLSKEKDEAVKNFSLGMRQKLGIATALLNSPDLLILDEPINGLDPVAIVEVRNILRKINKEKGTTIFISSHILGELEKLVSKYGFIREGKLVEEITEADVVQKGTDLESYFIKLMGVDINE